jgi:hypothetical protein
MKPVQFAAAIIGVGLASIAFAVDAATPAPAIASQPAPRPMVVVEPSNLPRGFAGGVVYVEFSLDENGRPRNIRLPWVYESDLKREVVKAFKQWQFAPVRTEAAAPEKRFLLPLEVKPQA